MSDFPPIIEVLSDHYKYWEYGIGYTDIQLLGLPESIIVDHNRLIRKKEFHITTINIQKISELIDKDNSKRVMSEIVEEFKKFLQKHKLDRFHLTNNFRFVQRNEEMTVIVMCDLIGVPKFFDLLRKKYNKTIPTQPFHITLYTLNSRYGIGILSDEILHQISRPIELPELRNLKTD